VGTSSVRLGTDPTYTAYDALNGFVYVSDLGLGSGSTVTVINGTSVAGNVSVGGGPGTEALDSSNGYVYVPNYSSDNVSVINGTSIVGSVAVGVGPSWTVYDNGNGYIYVTNLDSSTVSVINGTRLIATVNLPAYSGPEFASYDREDGYIYVTDVIVGEVTIINGTVVAGTVTVGYEPQLCAYDSQNGYVYVPNSGSDNLSVINGTRAVGSVSLPSPPSSATYVAGNGYVYVTVPASDSISVIDGDAQVGWVYDGPGSRPAHAAFDPTDGYLFVTNSASDNVSLVDGTKLIGAASVGAGPEYMTFDSRNGYVYVVNSASNNASVLLVGYEATFWEKGLPPLAGWWLNVSGFPPVYSANSTISLNESFGNYFYNVSTSAKNYSSPGGSFEAPGAPASFLVAFSLIPYPVTFTEAGLAAGTDWSVTIGGLTHTSNTTSVDFQEPNGTHAYRIGVVPGWTAGSYLGVITVRGGATPTTISWRPVVYNIDVTESGLPAWTEWWVNLTLGRSTNSIETVLSFAEANGTYAYSVGSLDKRYGSPGGSFTIDGRNVSVAVAFSEVNYTVTFAEAGLPSDTGWWVNVTGGPSTFSTGDSLSFDEPNGTYSYSATATRSDYSSGGGSLVVDGAGVSKLVTYMLTAFVVTFTESGLPEDMTWSVTFCGTKESGVENLAFPGVRNGTCPFTIGAVSGYVANRSSGTVLVHGGDVSEPIVFAPSGPVNGGQGGLTEEGYAILGGLVAAGVVATAVMILRGRRRKTPGSPAVHPAPPDVGAPRSAPKFDTGHGLSREKLVNVGQLRSRA
jgi:YVTN family beta-propeller protein